MRKVFALTAAIFLLMFASVAAAQANYNFMRVSDLGAQAFVDRMGYGNIYQTMKQNGTVVAFTAPSRQEGLDDPQNFPGLSVYRSLFGIQGTQAPNGQIRFYVDLEGYVFVLQVINEGEPQLSGMVLLMTMEALGLNDQEAAPLIQTPTSNAETYCANAGRKILRLVTDQAGNNVMLFGASN